CLLPSVRRRHRVRFSFYSYDDHPDLPSFPTRRSSDLQDMINKIKTAKTQVDLLIGAFHWGKEYELIPTADPGVAPDDPKQIAKLDRKSTRLNSSHVKISYAVFCLKKKKTADSTVRDR